MTDFNTVALAYTNDKGEVVAWSADTFGSPRKYPKTYQDCDETRLMLSKKFKSREGFGEKAANKIGELNSVGGAIMSASLNADKDLFSKLGVTGSVLVKLDLVTNYARGVDLPKWKDVEDCVDNKKYQLI